MCSVFKYKNILIQINIVTNKQYKQNFWICLICRYSNKSVVLSAKVWTNNPIPMSE